MESLLLSIGLPFGTIIGQDFDDLVDLYMTSDIAMITPVRDGMNLVAKEFVATRVMGNGVLILSEMAGAPKNFMSRYW